MKHFSFFFLKQRFPSEKKKDAAPNVVFIAMMRRVRKACNVAEVCRNAGMEPRYRHLLAVGVWF